MSQNFKLTKYFITQQHVFDSMKGHQAVTLVCSICNTEYQKTKKNVLQHETRQVNANLFCSSKCLGFYKTKLKTIETDCSNCGVKTVKKKSQYAKSSHHFCSRSCSTTFNNKQKKYGTKRSKLEYYLEEKLREEFPNLRILYSNKEIIGSELDIYIPSLKLAFEIQGIFHYEPIYGQEKLEKIQKNDKCKIDKCNIEGIKLVHIDCSKQKQFTEKSSQPYLNQITNKIKSLLSGIGDSNPL